jgi:hypothetical protein
LALLFVLAITPPSDSTITDRPRKHLRAALRVSLLGVPFPSFVTSFPE